MSKLTAPTLPKGYRFHVGKARDPEYVCITLERKGLFLWSEVGTEWAKPWAYEIQKAMEKLTRYTRAHETTFQGFYPPREEL